MVCFAPGDLVLTCLRPSESSLGDTVTRMAPNGMVILEASLVEASRTLRPHPGVINNVYCVMCVHVVRSGRDRQSQQEGAVAGRMNACLQSFSCKGNN